MKTEYAPGYIVRVIRSRVLPCLVASVAACGAPPQRGTSAPPPPSAEFLVATGDSTFWVTSGPAGVRARGLPIELARFDDRFYEVYAVDDDRSFEDALLVGQRLYRRDLESGDSLDVFTDTMVPRVARAYAQAHPNAEPLGPDDEGSDDPSTVATAELDLLDVYGPYLSFAYRVDLQLGASREGEPLHTARYGVVDLRAGLPATLRDLFGDLGGARLAAAGKRAYRSIADSIRLANDVRGRRAAQSLAAFQFDETSFTLTALDGAPAIAFAVPGRASAPEVLPLPLPPIRASLARVPWWDDVALTLLAPEGTVALRWHGRGYDVVATTGPGEADTTAQLAITDSTRRQWLVAALSAPPLHIFALDSPVVSAVQRRALVRAFEQASQYDEAVRTVARRTRPRRRIIVRQVTNRHRQPAHSPYIRVLP